MLLCFTRTCCPSWPITVLVPFLVHSIACKIFCITRISEFWSESSPNLFRFNNCLAACIALTLPALIWLVVLPSKTERLSVKTRGWFGFLPNTNRFRLIPWTFCKEFWPLRLYTNAISKLNLIFSLVSLTPSAITVLCLSTNPVLHGLLAAVVFILMLRFPQKSLNCSLLNSPPLSTRNFCRYPKVLIQIPNNCLTVTSFLLLLITADALYLVAWYAGGINQVFEFASVHSFKSIATISLNLCAIDNPTLDFVYTCLYLLQISQVSLIPAKIWNICVSNIEGSFRRFSIFWYDAWQTVIVVLVWLFFYLLLIYHSILQ